MLTANTFHINFDYALSEKVMVRLTAMVTCNYILPCYMVSGLKVTNGAVTNFFQNDIKLIPTVQDNHIEWLHTESSRSSILSTAIGKAIEATGMVEMLQRGQVA